MSSITTMGKRLALLFLIVVPAGAVGEGARPPLAQQLLEIYRQRCQAEIRALAAGLDAMEKKHPAPIEGESAGGLQTKLEAAWADGRVARSEYRALLEATRKYTRWARDSKLPGGFETPARMVEEATRARRWNALRPVILPMRVEELAPGERLGWSEPAGDPSAWQTDEARILEWLLLLRWLGEPPADVTEIDRDWLEDEVGAPFLERWKKEAADGLEFLHGDYRYSALRPPAGIENEMLRVRHVVSRLASAVESPLALPRLSSGATAPVIPARERVQRKEALMQLLLSGIRSANGSDPIALDWFRCGARAFPFLTELAPEGIEPVRAMRERETGTDPFRKDLEHLEDIAPDVAASLRASFFRYQLVLRGDGTWEAPPAGWSSGTPVDRDASPPASAVRVPGVPPAAKTPAAKGPLDRSRILGPANAWSSICQWILQELEGLPPERGRRFRAGKVEYRGNGWYLALGRDELGEMLAKRWPESRDAGAGAAAVPVDVEVLRVEPHRSLGLRLVVGQEEVARQAFRIAGPWPGWFAARYRPTLDGQMLFPVFCLLLAALVILRSWRRRRDQPETVGLLVMMVTPLVVWTASGTLAPRTVGERGGTVEFALPTDGSVPSRLRELGRLVSVHVFLRLCRESGPAASLDEPEADPFLERLTAVARRVVDPWPLLPRHDAAPEPESPSLLDMEYRITGYSHGRETVRRGPLDLAHLLSFKRTLGALDHRGEKSIPPSMDTRELQPASLMVVVSDGDHGGLVPPAIPAGDPEAPLVVLCPTGPGRDRGRDRELGAASRIRWLTERSSLVAVLEPDGKLRPAREALADLPGLARADASGHLAQDLDVAREAWWATLDQESQSEAAKGFAAEAVDRFRSGRTSSSRSVLTMTFVQWKLALLLVTAVLCVAFPLWLRKVGLRDRAGILRFLASALLAGILLIACLSMLGLQDVMRSYGIETTEALRCGTWWCMIGLMLGLAVSLVFMALARSSPYTRLIRGADLTWSVTPVPDRLQPWIRAAGLILVGAGVAWTLICPVAHVGVESRLVPRDLWATGMWGIGFFMLGAAMLWHEPRALRVSAPKEGPPDAFSR